MGVDIFFAQAEELVQVEKVNISECKGVSYVQIKQNKNISTKGEVSLFGGTSAWLCTS